MFWWAGRASVAWRQAAFVLGTGLVLSASATWVVGNAAREAYERSVAVETIRLSRACASGA